jgi:hypothetical protein
MADVKVPALLHKMSKAAQKAWYKKNNMAMPDDAGGRSAAAAKRVKVAPRKEIAVEPNSVRAINAAKQKAYMAKGGRQPIGAAGSGGHSSMAGSNMSTAKGIVAGIKAGFNPKVSLDPYESEKAKKVGPRSLKLKKESVDKEMIGEVSRMMDKVIKKPSSVDIASDVTKFLERGGKVTVYKPQKAKFRAGTALASKHDTTVAKAAGGKHVMRNQIGKNLGLARAGLLNKMLTPSKKEKFATESVELDEVTKKEAEAVIGGPVKEKPKMPPGKQPAGYRYVRSLARKAMKGGVSAIHKSMEKTMQKEDVNEAVKDVADVGEYDYEGDMAKSQLRSIMANSKRMHDMLEENTNLPEWVQSKITLAEDYISTASNYMQGEMNEEVEQIDEKMNLAKAKMGDVVKDFYKSKAPQFKGKSMAKRREMAVAAKLGAEREAGMREEVEQIDELKKSTLASYVGKAAGRLAAASRLQRGFEKDGHTALAGEFEQSAQKRKVGIQKAANKLAKEEVVTEAEGTVAVTPKEKALAAHHGDPKKITYGDVIKARLKSAAAKKMGK